MCYEHNQTFWKVFNIELKDIGYTPTLDKHFFQTVYLPILYKKKQAKTISTVKVVGTEI